MDWLKKNNSRAVEREASKNFEENLEDNIKMTVDEQRGEEMKSGDTSAKGKVISLKLLLNDLFDKHK